MLITTIKVQCKLKQIIVKSNILSEVKWLTKLFKLTQIYVYK